MITERITSQLPINIKNPESFLFLHANNYPDLIDGSDITKSLSFNDHFRQIEIEGRSWRKWELLDFEKFYEVLEENSHITSKVKKTWEISFSKMVSSPFQDHVEKAYFENKEEIKHELGNISFDSMDTAELFIVTCRYAAALGAARKRFVFQEEKMANKKDGSSRVSQIKHGKWDRYPEDFKEMVYAMLDKDLELTSKEPRRRPLLSRTWY